MAGAESRTMASSITSQLVYWGREEAKDGGWDRVFEQRSKLLDQASWCSPVIPATTAGRGRTIVSSRPA
jgi:hypothetical protein